MYCACMSVGKPGYSSVTMSALFSGPLLHHAYRFAVRGHAHAALFQLLQQRAQVKRIATSNEQVAAGKRTGDDERTGLNAVGDDAMTRAAQLLHAANADGVRAGALNLRAHLPSSAARSNTSGSRAQFSSTVSPSASVAAISRSSVPVTVIFSKMMRAPFSRVARA